MGKETRARILGDHQAMAVARNIRVSPRKLNLVAQMIRGKKVDRALNVLTFSQKRIASVVKKVVMKRFHARARGNAGGIEKFFSQITIIVEEKREEAPAKDETKADAPKSKAKKTSGKAPAKKPAARKSAAKKEAA
jgi:large subunit ribosomal protein L22